MTEENRKIVFICSKGDLDMAYPALIMGWAALGNGVDVTLFFTFWGMDLINKARVDHLELSPVGNTSMKMNLMGVPGHLGIPNVLSVLPGMTAFATWLMKHKMAKLEVPPVREYLHMMAEAGAKLYACKMTNVLYGLKKEDYIDEVLDILTASEVIDESEGAQIILV